LPLIVHGLARQQMPPEHDVRLAHVTAQDFPEHWLGEEHDAMPVQAIWLLVPALVVIAPLQDDVPVHSMSQLAAVQLTVPEHEAMPHETRHDEPAHVTEPQEAVVLQSTTQLLAALQSTATAVPPGGVTEHGTPAGHLGQAVPVHATTHVPPLQVPTPAHREAHSAFAAGPASADAIAASVPGPASSCGSASTPSVPSAVLTAASSGAVASRTGTTVPASPGIPSRPLAPSSHPVPSAPVAMRTRASPRYRGPSAYARRIDSGCTSAPGASNVSRWRAL
jgi:hypothetical protein